MGHIGKTDREKRFPLEAARAVEGLRGLRGWWYDALVLGGAWGNGMIMVVVDHHSLLSISR